MTTLSLDLSKVDKQVKQQVLEPRAPLLEVAPFLHRLFNNIYSLHVTVIRIPTPAAHSLLGTKV